MGCSIAEAADEDEDEGEGLLDEPWVPLGDVPLVPVAPEDPDAAVPDALEPLVDGDEAVVTVVFAPTAMLVKPLEAGPETMGGPEATTGIETVAVVVGTSGMPGEPEMNVIGVACEVTATVCEAAAVGWVVTGVGMPVTTPRELVRLR